ncbi:PA3496 family putative envelope integrity protein [Marinicellulosiphila megalodicopiae]|uniref:PA3496 family putative envelope integrity protein n=1 Tax=Marinicellulosiphila megalodicopiae TaxID=2724896 RepID=UPI003BB1BB11
MSMNLLQAELSNIESNGLHKPAEVSETKRDRNHRKLAARRAVEEHLERQRLKEEYAMDMLD